jgi:hypothetical protein
MNPAAPPLCVSHDDEVAPCAIRSEVAIDEAKAIHQHQEAALFSEQAARNKTEGS